MSRFYLVFFYHLLTFSLLGIHPHQIVLSYTLKRIKEGKLPPKETLTNIINNNIPIAPQNYKALSSYHNDFGQSSMYIRNLKSVLNSISLFYLQFGVLAVAKINTEIELIGIKIAATTGCKYPETAKLSPTILYKKLIKMQFLQISLLSFANFKKFGIAEKLLGIQNSVT